MENTVASFEEVLSRQLANFSGDANTQAEGQDSQEQEEQDQEQDDQATGADAQEGDGDQEQESGDEDPSDDLVEVTLPDGTKTQVSQDELVKGYLRQSDYTRKQQSLKADAAAEFQTEKAALEAQMSELDLEARASRIINARFEQDPEALIGDMFLNLVPQNGQATEQQNTAAWVEVTKYLLGAGYLGASAAGLFGIDDNGIRAYSQQYKQRASLNARAAQVADQERVVAPVAAQQAEAKERAEYEEQANKALSEVASSKNISEADLPAFTAAVLQRMLEDEVYETKDIKRVANQVYREQQVAKRESELTKPAGTTRRAAPTNRPSGSGAGRGATPKSQAKPKVLHGKPQSIEERLNANLNRFSSN